MVHRWTLSKCGIFAFNLTYYKNLSNAAKLGLQIFCLAEGEAYFFKVTVVIEAVFRHVV